MSKRVFGLGDVSYEEATGVRQVLSDVDIEFFETPPGYPGQGVGTQGLNAAALWVADEDAPKARAEFEKFQAAWRLKVRADAAVSTEQKPHPWALPAKLLFVFFAVVLLMQVVRIFTS